VAPERVAARALRVAWLVSIASCVAARADGAAMTARAQPAAAPVIRIVALGDSTTARAVDWAPEIREVYADCLPASLAARGVAATVVNAGIGDTTTREAVERLERDVLRLRPDVVVVQFGINDSWIDVDVGRTRPRLTRRDFRRNLATIVGRVRDGGARAVLMTPNPMRWADPLYIRAFAEHPGLLDVHAERGIDRLLDVYAEDVRTVSRRERVPIVDVFRAFEDFGNEPGHSVRELLLAGDGIHPNQGGQHLVCRLLTDVLAKVLGGTAP
jgi:lysophospholipase L1-like esterase